MGRFALENKADSKGSYFEGKENAATSSAKFRGTDQAWWVMTADATGENISIDTYEIINGACEFMETITLEKQAGGPSEFYATFVIDETEKSICYWTFQFYCKIER